MTNAAEANTNNTTDLALMEARGACAEVADAAAVVASEYSEPVAVPFAAHDYGAAIERAKLSLPHIAEVRSNLVEAAALIKAAHADSLRGTKAALSEKDKRELEQLLAEDSFYQRAISLAAELQTIWTRWDARRSRLNRDYEIARIDYAQAQVLDITDAVLVRLRDKLFNASDYFVKKLRGAL